MALLDAQTEERLRDIEYRLDEIERILAVLLEEQEEEDNGEEKEVD